ncbi:MAG: NarK/NasA family nitrate transporter [Proteobacteria bacterium]|nr:NarK/NasA family nitrate transporter [Pseudomonadota bacterium]
MQGQADARGLTRAVTLSTFSFTICFAVWTIFSIIGVQIKANLNLNDTEFGFLVGVPILVGSLTRLFLGIWAAQFGGRRIMFVIMTAASVATWLLSYATTYPGFIAAALGVGLAGGAFAVGVAYVADFAPPSRKGTVLGIFGMGNVGAAVTKFIAPFVMIAFGWTMVAQIWAVVLFATAVGFYFLSEDEPTLAARRIGAMPEQGFMAQLQPLKELQVWRFSLYYFFVFGAFVALALWLPRYYVGVYGLDIRVAGMLGAAYSIPGSIFRVLGGVLSDKYGARRVMYWTFAVSVICTFFLSYPATEYLVHGIKQDISFSLQIGIVPFTILTFVLGFFMSLGKAAVYKHIPVYFPNNVGSVGGVVGMIGGLGGFVLPFAFGFMNDVTGVWTSCFMLLFVLVAMAFLWMHLAIRRIERRQNPELTGPKYFPELAETPAQH